MLFAAILLAISVVTFGQLALYYWRAILAGVAAQPLTDRVCEAAGLTGVSVGSADFRAVLDLYRLTPGIRDGDGGLGLVRAYYHAVEALGRLAGLRLPSLAAWADREMATCSRYVAVRLGQRLESNLACVADIRSC